MRRRWLWAIRVAASSCFLLSALEPLLYPDPVPPVFWRLAVFYPGLLSYVVVLWRLRRGPDRFGARLAIAQTTIALSLELPNLGALAAPNVRVVVFDGVWTLLHLAFLATGIRNSRLLGPGLIPEADPRSIHRWLWVVRAVTMVLAMVLIGVVVSTPAGGDEALGLWLVALTVAGGSVWRLRHGPERTGLALGAIVSLFMGAVLLLFISNAANDLVEGLLTLWWLGYVVQIGASSWLWKLQWPAPSAATRFAEQSAAFRRWLWGLRATAGACLLASIFFPPLLMLVPLSLVLVVRGDRRSALRAAVLISGFGALICLMTLAAPRLHRTRLDMGVVLIEAVLLGLGAIALRTHSLLPLDPTSWPRRWRLPSVLFIAIALLSIVATSALMVADYSRRFASSEASAIGTLRSISSGNSSYLSTYDNGYAPALDALAPSPSGQPPSCQAANMLMPHIDDRFYRFEYRPGPPVDKSGQNCARLGAKTFSVVARPVHYNETGLRSFYTDERGMIFQTSEDRAATAQDPPL